MGQVLVAAAKFLRHEYDPKVAECLAFRWTLLLAA